MPVGIRRRNAIAIERALLRADLEALARDNIRQLDDDYEPPRYQSDLMEIDSNRTTPISLVSVPRRPIAQRAFGIVEERIQEEDAQLEQHDIYREEQERIRIEALGNKEYSTAGLSAGMIHEQLGADRQQVANIDVQQITQSSSPISNFLERKRRGDVDTEAKKKAITDKMMTTFELDQADGKITRQGLGTKHIAGKSDRYNNAKLRFGGSFEEELSKKTGRESYYMKKYLINKGDLHCSAKGTHIDIQMNDGFDAIATKLKGFKEATTSERISDILTQDNSGLAGHEVFVHLTRICLATTEMRRPYDLYIFVLCVMFSWLEVAQARIVDEIDQFINENWWFNLPIVPKDFQKLVPDTRHFELRHDNLVTWLKGLKKMPDRRSIDRTTLIYDTERLFDSNTIDSLLDDFCKQEVLDGSHPTIVVAPILSLTERQYGSTRKSTTHSDLSIHEVVGRAFSEIKPPANDDILLHMRLERLIPISSEVLRILNINKAMSRRLEPIYIEMRFRNCVCGDSDPHLLYRIESKKQKTIRPAFSIQHNAMLEMFKRLGDASLAIDMYHSAIGGITTDTSTVFTFGGVLYRLVKYAVKAGVSQGNIQMKLSWNFSDEHMTQEEAIRQSLGKLLAEHTKGGSKKKAETNSVLAVAANAEFLAQGRKEVDAMYSAFLNGNTDGSATSFTYNGNDYTLVDDGVFIGDVAYRRAEENFSLQYKPSFMATPFEIVQHKLNVLDMKMAYGNDLSLDIKERFYGAQALPNGLHSHQKQFVEEITRAFILNMALALLFIADVGAGKTTAVIAAVRGLMMLSKKPFVIYATSKKANLAEMFERCTHIEVGNSRDVSKFSVLGACHTKYKGKDTLGFFDAPGSFNQEAKLQKQTNILICHTRTLLTVLDMLEKDTKTYQREYLVILDEIAPEHINSENEHAIGAIFAKMSLKNSGTTKQTGTAPIRFVAMSASIAEHSQIQYFTRKVPSHKFLTNHNILVPTTLRQFNGELMDLFAWLPPKQVLPKIKSNAFFRRWITWENIKPLFARDKELAPLGNRASAQAMEAHSVYEHKRKFEKTMQEAGIFDPATIFLLYDKHEEEERVKRADYDKAEEMNHIKKTEYYTLVATPSPHELMADLYKPVASFIEAELNGYINEKGRKVKGYVERYTTAQKLVDQLEGTRHMDSRNLTSGVRQNLIDAEALSNWKRQGGEDVKKIEELAAELGRDAKALMRIVANETQMRALLLDLNTRSGNSAKLSMAKAERDQITTAFMDKCDQYLQHLGFNHNVKCSINPQKARDFIQRNENYDPDYLYTIMNVAAYETADEEISQNRMNRIFFNETGARGLDLPLESIVITEAFSDVNDSDTILQMCGRCGRFSRVVKSVVFMSANCYMKLMLEKDSTDTRDVMFRMKYYLQDINTRNITEAITTDRTAMKITRLFDEIHVSTRF